jgi:hypothetical protein
MIYYSNRCLMEGNYVFMLFQVVQAALLLLTLMNTN